MAPASATGGSDRRPRAVLLIANTAAPYSRGLRVARSLVEAGWEVEIAAVAGPGVADDEHDGAVRIRRFRPTGVFRRWADQPPPPKPPTQVLRNLVRRADKGLKAWFWPIHVRGWWAALRKGVPPADLYHAFGILTLPVAIELGKAARRAGRAGIVVYDVIDAILDSNNYQHVPGPVLARYKAKEAGWVRRVDAVVTVNDALADHCSGSGRSASAPRCCSTASRAGTRRPSVRTSSARRPGCRRSGRSCCSSAGSAASAASRRPRTRSSGCTTRPWSCSASP